MKLSNWKCSFVFSSQLSCDNCLINQMIKKEKRSSEFLNRDYVLSINLIIPVYTSEGANQIIVILVFVIVLNVYTM